MLGHAMCTRSAGMAQPHYNYFPSLSREQSSRWLPSVDVYRSERDWLLKCDMAGVNPAEIRVEIQGSRVTVAGVRRDLSLTRGHRVYSMEICYDHFERSIELPVDADLQQAQTEIGYCDGMLLITITPPPSPNDQANDQA